MNARQSQVVNPNKFKNVQTNGGKVKDNNPTTKASTMANSNQNPQLALKAKKTDQVLNQDLIDAKQEIRVNMQQSIVSNGIKSATKAVLNIKEEVNTA